MTPQLNGLTLILVAGYLGVVVYKGNVDELFTLLSGEKDFLKWAIATMVIYWLWKSNPAGELVAGIAGIALIAVAMRVIPAVLPVKKGP